MHSETDIRFRVQGMIDGHPPSHSVMASVEWQRDDPSSISAELTFLGSPEERVEVLRHLSTYRGEDFIVRSSRDGVETLQMRKGHWYRLDDDGAVISANEIRAAYPQPQLVGALRSSFAAQLTPSGILTVPATIEGHRNGSMVVKPAFEDNVEFNVGLGRWQVSSEWHSHRDNAFGNQLRVSTQRTVVSGEIEVPEGTTMDDLHERVRGELSTVCTLLSLCYRQPVRCYEVQYWMFQDGEEGQLCFKPIVRYRQAQRSRGDREQCLIGTRNLILGGFQRLLDSYRNANSEGRLSQAIAFLSSSYDEGTVETNFFLAFTALELLVGICDQARVPKLAREIRLKIREFLRALGDEYGCHEELGVVKSKLGELLRPAIASRIMGIIEARSLKVDDIYPMSLSEGVRLATKIRNDLVHKALVTDYDDLVIAGIRIRALVERLILHLLQWPMDQLDYNHNRDLGYIIDKECLGK